MAQDNRKLTKAEDDKNLQDILNDDDVPIPEDVATENMDTKNDTPAPVTPPVEPAPAPEPELAPEPDYKKKFQDSSSEATTLHFKNEQMKNKIDEASNLPEPSLPELRAYAISQGAVYDDLDEFAVSMLKNSYRTANQFRLIKEASDAGQEIDVWAKAVDKFANSAEIVAKYPSLADNESAFKKHCMKKNRRGMELEDLATSFLFTIQTDEPKKVPKKKGGVLLSRGGGGDSIPKPKEVTAEELRIIRTTNPARYKKLIVEGKVGLDLLERE